MRTRATNAFTLVELILSAALFSMLMLVFGAILTVGLRAWRNMEARHLAERDLRQASYRLLKDLKSSRADRVRTSTLANMDGQVLWFSTCLRRNGEPCRDPDGEPIWQGTIAYYLIRPDPTWHSQLYGSSCSSWAGPGTDAFCPHKLLIRRRIETMPHTAMPATSAESEPLPANVDPFTGPTTRPIDWFLSNLPNPGGQAVETDVVARTLLEFSATPSVGNPDLLAIRLGAVRRLEAQKVLSVGSYDFSQPGNRSFVIPYTTGVFPGL